MQLPNESGRVRREQLRVVAEKLVERLVVDTLIRTPDLVDRPYMRQCLLDEAKDIVQREVIDQLRVEGYVSEADAAQRALDRDYTFKIMCIEKSLIPTQKIEPRRYHNAKFPYARLRFGL